MTIVTERAEIQARARVTDRMRPLRVEGRTVHQVAMPWHWGYAGAGPGDIANDLLGISGEPNVSIQESKAFTCDVRAGRREGSSTRKLAGAAPARAPLAPGEDDPLAENPKQAAE
jgi:formate dehydrogenase major subunit